MEGRDGSRGRVDRVMVACVTDEVLMLTEPARFYGIDRVHLINYVKEPDMDNDQQVKRYRLFTDVYDEVCRRMDGMGIEIVPHRELPTYNFEDMMSVLYDILSEETRKGSVIHVSVTGGTAVYAAATSVVTMMFPGAKLFNVGVDSDEHTVSDYDQKRRNMMHGGRLVGSAKAVLDPFPMEKIPLEHPDRKLLMSLKVLDAIPLHLRSNTNVIRNLIVNDLWTTSVGGAPGDTSMRERTSVGLEDGGFNLASRKDADAYAKLQNKERTQYQRVYIDQWKDLHWIEKDNSGRGNKYVLTDAGRLYLRVFCPDSVFAFGEDDVVYSAGR